MKKALINFLKIGIPLLLGIGLIWLFYDALCPQEKIDLFNAFRTADYKWVLLSLVFGWLSHLSRARRHLYLLKPLGHNASFWNSYHALMSGYLVNLAFPRAGEPYRAGALNKKENIPFQKVFGTIIAERAIDVVMLGIITVLMLILQLDKIDLFVDKVSNFSTQNSCGNSMVFAILGGLVKWGIIIGFFGGIAVFILKKSIRDKIIDFVKGILEGAFAIFKSKDILPFVGHTLFIWIMYVAMFSVCFYAIQETAGLGIDAMLAGFVAGTVGMIVVQGGIGVYPAFVGLIITIYLSQNEGVGISPEALALGWIIWTSQTIMMIVLGLVSFIVSSNKSAK